MSGATHDRRTDVADTFTRAVPLPAARDTQVGFTKAEVPGNQTHLSLSESGRSHACLSASVRPGDLRPNTNKQAEPAREAQTATFTLEESERPELVYEDEGVFPGRTGNRF